MVIIKFNTIKVISVLPFLLLSSYLIAHEDTRDLLQLIQSTPIHGSKNKELSGLSLCHGRLLTISDKDDHTIYEIETIDDKSRLLEYLKFTPPTPKYITVSRTADFIQYWMRTHLTKSSMDFEGITCTAESNILLASEAHTAVLQIQKDGSTEWVHSNLYEEGYKSGLFLTYNAYIEGIAAINRDALILSIEREPSGYIIYSEGQYQYLVNDDNMMDLSGLFYDRGNLYTLERRRSRVCKRSIKNVQTDAECRSFKHISSNPAYRYRGAQFNMEEGIALDNDHIYIVIDVNGRERSSNGRKETILFTYKRPMGF